MKINSFIKDQLLIIAVEIQLADNMLFELYEVFSLPTPHKTNPKLFSYIEPSKPYLLLSSTRTTYTQINTLENCNEYQKAEWLCEELTTAKRVEK